MFFRQIFDPKLAQYAYLIGCQQTGDAIIIDPQRDIDRYIDIALQEDLEIVATTETHIHADFLSGSREFAQDHGVHVYLSDEGDADWKYGWAHDPAYNVTLLKHDDVFRVGKIEFKVVHTPGHTPEHLAFMVTDVGGGADEAMGIISGDFVFVADLGRPDLLESAAGQSGNMEPSARKLFHSVESFLELPDYLQVWPGHGAGSACGKSLGAIPGTTVGYERRFNASIAAAEHGEDVFVDAILEGQPEPPLYFARMKTENKAGPEILGELPSPKRLSPEQLSTLSHRRDIAVVDTRVFRSEFMAGHLPASLFAPLDRTFNTVVGSYVRPETPIFLIIEENDIEEAVRDLVRIGLDDIAGFATPKTLSEVAALTPLSSIDVIDFQQARQMSNASQGHFLDVRRAAEYASAHLPASQNVAHTRLMERAEEIDSASTQLVYCRSGARAAVASAFLARLGHKVTYIDDHFSAVPAPDLETATPAIAAVGA